MPGPSAWTAALWRLLALRQAQARVTAALWRLLGEAERAWGPQLLGCGGGRRTTALWRLLVAPCQGRARVGTAALWMEAFTNPRTWGRQPVEAYACGGRSLVPTRARAWHGAPKSLHKAAVPTRARCSAGPAKADGVSK